MQDYFCAECGATIPVTASFCDICGAAVQVASGSSDTQVHAWSPTN